MTAPDSFPTRPDGLVDGTRVPWDALSNPTACAHPHARRVVAPLDGRDDVWECPPWRGCGERWRRQGAPVGDLVLPRADYDRLQAMADEPTQALRDLVARADREHQLRRSRYVVVPDTDTKSGPSGLLARFRNRTKKDRP